MKVVVINGSPKGALGVSLQYARYLIQRQPEHDYEVVHVGERIDELVASRGAFDEVIAAVERARLVLWVTPVYCYLVPAQLKRFIELVHERGAAPAFAGRYAAVATTSSHFFDHTAHRYLNAVCDDLELRYAGGFSAEMYDLLRPQGRAQWETFTRSVLDVAGRGEPVTRTYPALAREAFDYRPAKGPRDLDLAGRRLVVLTDTREQGNLGRMVDRFVGAFSGGVERVSLDEVHIAGGCLGSVVRCGLEHACERDDGFVAFYRERLMTADLLLFAGTVVDRHLSHRWKEFFDRSLFHGHVPSLAGKQVGWIISGPLRQIPNLRDTLEASVELQMANLVDIVTDEDADSTQIDALLQQLARRLLHFARQGYVGPPTFLGVGGMKVCRHIVERNRFLFQADYPFYRDNLGHDLPPHDLAATAKNALLIPLTRVPGVAGLLDRKFKQALVLPFRRLFTGR